MLEHLDKCKSKDANTRKYLSSPTVMLIPIVAHRPQLSVQNNTKNTNRCLVVSCSLNQPSLELDSPALVDIHAFPFRTLAFPLFLLALFFLQYYMPPTRCLQQPTVTSQHACIGQRPHACCQPLAHSQYASYLPTHLSPLTHHMLHPNS